MFLQLEQSHRRASELQNHMSNMNIMKEHSQINNGVTTYTQPIHPALSPEHALLCGDDKTSVQPMSRGAACGLFDQKK